jgi:hypothetical protein
MTLAVPLYMASFMSWVDYSSAERLHMRQAVALFEEKETRDELGIGPIRDAIADTLFPGTSVIQTRLRYALFIPWIYQRFERDRRYTTANVERCAREAELALIDPLLCANDTVGVIGSRAGRALQRLPSSVYWLALQRWGIFRQRSTQDQYHRDWERLRRRRGNQLSADDVGVPPLSVQTWHAALPAAPDGFPDHITFELTVDEADFLRGRIAETCRGSLLALAVTGPRACRSLQASKPWDAFDDLPLPLGETLSLAHRFALLVQGAALAYNLALARRAPGREDLATTLEEAISAWALEANQEDIGRPELDDLWQFCAERARVSVPTQDFIERWRGLLRLHGYAVACSSPDAHTLIESRERLLKGKRSRFENPRSLDTWGGQAGTGLLTYRWSTVQRFLDDLYRGTARSGG